MLLVISNFNYLADVLIPSMLSQLEAAFGISLLEDRQVSGPTHRERSIISRDILNLDRATKADHPVL